ncbi:MAG: SDR family NAD(P)-dependent oxidoreductase [Gammaproteobacteria bacterium]|nr:SDR family NAD(P)-dependent oxidoreductase [Gammaproteobacteria bacterium]NIR85442.1 SDR family NAD(P)-dependent oxidoreductase [Gammaproteobacteria bacterium]NIR89433.1 SDR family NAD(P)-dependent oxidoreductase [Gammaproteobacteria bacterium]NIU06578.1 SDR family NAD(P)-dependent oxidoreductase [Gammaproteobacteria bacterium]NIV53461.1 SDR family NAD(P)-dependent oxidoreductase [Gammaproteobacteria bacterium]
MAHSSLSPQGRVVLVSGANRGIGRAIVERLHAEGYALSLGAREESSLDPIVSRMDPKRTMVHAFEARDANSPSAWVAAVHARFGRIDGVVNNAGVMHGFDVEDPDESKLDAMWETNAKGPLRLIRAAFPYLKACGAGRVVNIVSLSGVRVRSARVAGYAMSKHAALALTHAVRYSGWEHGVRATAICPGYVATDMTAGVRALAREEMIPAHVVAQLVATVLALPNSASVTELPVNCVLEHSV